MYSPNTPITVAIVGLGRAGWNLHLQPILEIKGLKIVAVAEPDPQRQHEAIEATGCEAYNSIDEQLSRSDAQVVIVATPSITHYDDARKVLSAGRHCILEKPMAMNYNEAKEIVSLAAKKNLKLFVNHTFLHRPEYHHFRRVIDRGVLGPLFNIRVISGRYSRRWDWQALKKNGGGQLNNTCSHLFSLVLPLLDSPVKEIFADSRNIKDVGDAEDHVHVVVRTESGMTGDFTTSTALAGPSGPTYTLNGKYGALVSDGQTSKLRYYAPDSVAPLEIVDAAAPDRVYVREELPWTEEELTVDSFPVPSFHQNVFDVLVGKADQIVTPESAAEVVRVIEMAQKAASRLT